MIRRALPVLVGLAAVCCAGLGAQEAPPGEGPTMLVSGSASFVVEGREESIPVLETERGPLFPLQALVARLGGELEVGPLGQAHVLSLHDEEIVVGPESPVMTIGRTVIELSQAPRTGIGGLHVPLDMLRRSLGEILGYEFLWNGDDRRLFVMPKEKRRIRVDWEVVHIQGISTLVLRFETPPRYRVETRDGRVVVEILGDELLPPDRPTLVDDPLIRSLRIRPDRIVVIAAPESIVDHYEQSKPPRLVFDVYRRLEAEGDRDPALGVGEAPGVPAIVIDPGHGGEETGAVGPSGVEEKELTLSISRVLARRLEAALPVRVVLTRDGDADLPLDTRTAIANQNRAELFVSIHLNSSLGRNAHGAETYFLSLEASDAGAAASAAEENRSAESAADDPLADLELILWDLAQSRYLAESQSLARLVQEELNRALGLRDRGVRQAPFRVLMGAAMPAILVELGFISNPEEEAKLVRPAYQGELVDALVRAIARFFRQRDGIEADAEP